MIAKPIESEYEMDEQTIALAAVIFGLFGGVATAWLRPVFQRMVQQKNEIRYLREEFRDLERHINLNLKVIALIRRGQQLPLEMHLAKLKIPQDSAVFSIDTLKLADPKVASRLYEMRLKMRNLNIEIDDLIQLAKCQESATFFELLEYHRQKCQRAIEVLATEGTVLERSKPKGRQKSLVIAKIIPRPQSMSSNPASLDAQQEMGAVGSTKSTDSEALGTEPTSLVAKPGNHRRDEDAEKKDVSG